jgi:alanine dehydrogenase
MSSKLGIDVIAVDNAERVVKDSQICITATKSTTPIVRGEWIQEGLHINAIGADCPVKSELDASALKRADKLVIDCKQALDTGDLRVLLERGILEPSKIYGTIGEIVAGLKQGRENASEVTIFKSTGMTIPYVAISAMIYKEASKRGLGIEVSSLL